MTLSKINRDMLSCKLSMTEIDIVMNRLREVEIDKSTLSEVVGSLRLAKLALKKEYQRLDSISPHSFETITDFKMTSVSSDNEVIFSNGFKLKFIAEDEGSARVDFRSLMGTKFAKDTHDNIKVSPTNGGILINDEFVKGYDVERVVLKPSCHVILVDENDKVVNNLATLKKNDILKFEYRPDLSLSNL